MEKLICVDIDGTILPFEGRISKEVLNVLHSDEYKFIMATGRPVKEIRDFGINIDCVASNGAEVYKDGELLFRNELKSEVISNVVKELISQVGNATLCTNKGRIMYAHADFDLLVREIVIAVNGEFNQDVYDNMYPHITENAGLFEDIDKFLAEEDVIITKVEANTFDKLEMLLSYVEDNFAVSTFTSLGGHFEVVPEGANKSEAIKKYIGDEEYQIIAIGDGDNDIDMFKMADVGIAMDNSTDGLKAVASHHTKDVNDNGFLHAIDMIRNGL